MIQPEVLFLSKELKEEVNDQENEERKYEEIPFTVPDINFWHFLNYMPIDDRRMFFQSLDNCGWEHFGEALSLTMENIVWCSKYYDKEYGPTYTALQEIKKIGKHDDLCLTHVLSILKEMDRFDILRKIEWLALAEKSLLKMEEKAKQLSFIGASESQEEALLNSTNIGGMIFEKNSDDLKPLKEKSKKSFVFLTYATRDAEEIAFRICSLLRNGNNKRPKIRILTINDPKVRRHLLNSPFEAIMKWIKEARYVVPLLSPEYLNQIHLKMDPDDDSEVRYNRLIYRAIIEEFVEFGSMNYKCRSLCPDAFKEEVLRHPLVTRNPLFTACHATNEKELEKFARLLLYRQKH